MNNNDVNRSTLMWFGVLKKLHKPIKKITNGKLFFNRDICRIYIFNFSTIFSTQEESISQVDNFTTCELQ